MEVLDTYATQLLGKMDDDLAGFDKEYLLKEAAEGRKQLDAGEWVSLEEFRLKMDAAITKGASARIPA